MKHLFFSLMLAISSPSFASWIDSDTLAHRVQWTYLNDQSPAGRQAYDMYQNFSSTDLSGTSHAYLQSKYEPKHSDWGIGFSTALYQSDKTALVMNTNYHVGQPSEKLSVEPSFKLGFQVSHLLLNRPESLIAIVGGASHIFGGRTKEKSCVETKSPYREFNCRAAVSIVDAPLLDKKPDYQTEVSVRFIWQRDFF